MDRRAPLTKTSTLSKTSSLGLIWGIAEWTDGTLVLSDAERHTICNLVLPNLVNVIAGTGTAGFLDGVGEKAIFNTPKGIALTEEAEVLVADSSNHRIRQVSSSGYVTTLSGTGKRGSTDGPAKSATWDLPLEIAHLSSGTGEPRVLVASFNSPYLRCIHEGHVTTLTSPASSSSSLNASSVGVLLNRSSSSASLAGLKTMSPDIVSPIFGFVRDVGSAHLSSLITKLEERLVNGGPGLVDGNLEDACFRSLNAMISNQRGDVIVMDCGNHAIRLITIEGKVTTISGTGLAGHRDGVANSTRMCFPRTMLLTKQGELLIADTGNCCLRRIELSSCLQPLWIPNHVQSRNFNYLLPGRFQSTDTSPNTSNKASSTAKTRLTASEDSMKHETTPIFADLHWGTSNAGNWHLHRCILYARCPGLMDAAIQTKFLDLKVSVQAYMAFWEFLYNDIFPIFKGDVASTNLMIELIAIFQCVQHNIAYHYACWILSHAIDNLQSVEEIAAVIPFLVNLQLSESLKTAVRILTRRVENPKTEEIIRQVMQVVAGLDDPDFQSWIKRRSSMSSSYSRKISEKSPPSPFGTMEKDLGTLLVRDESNGHRIRFADLALKVAVDQLSCHRAILYKRWPFITDHIDKVLSQSTESSKLPIVIELPVQMADLRIASLYGLLWYFYTSSLDMLKEEDCTDLARVYEHLQVDDERLRAHVFHHGFVDLSTVSPNLWIQPVEPPASSCSVQ